MAKEYYNYKNKKWGEEKIIRNEDIHKIVGNDVMVSIDSNGNIEINKTLTAEEKQKIEGL